VKPTNATYFDGRVAARVPVAVEQEPGRIVIRDAAGNVLAQWPHTTLKVIERPHRGHAGVITDEAHDPARLTIADGALFHAIEARIPHHVRDAHRKRHVLVAAGSAVAIAIVLTGLWLGWSPLMDMAARAVPRSWEAKIGRSVSAQLMPKKACVSPDGLKELDRLTDRLAAAAGHPADFTVSVVENKTVNAFAAPGGYIVLHSALIASAQGPDEVAGVLAHEMAHVIGRHSMRLLARYYGLNMIVTAFTGQSRFIEGLTMFQVFAYSREFEADADQRAIELLKAAGIRSDGLASFFGRMDKSAPDSGLLQYFSTHPPTSDRRALAEQAGTGGKPAMSEDAWQALRKVCEQQR
jgi:predicted Zn-dependent protease